HVHDVAGPQQARVGEVARLEVQRVERAETRVLRIAVAARSVELEPEARRPADALERVARVARDGPGPDRVAFEAAELEHRLPVAVEAGGSAGDPASERVALLEACARFEDRVLVAESEVVDVDARARGSADGGRAVQAPERLVVA